MNKQTYLAFRDQNDDMYARAATLVKAKFGKDAYVSEIDFNLDSIVIEVQIYMGGGYEHDSMSLSLEEFFGADWEK
jgi:hypothetical protein